MEENKRSKRIYIIICIVLSIIIIWLIAGIFSKNNETDNASLKDVVEKQSDKKLFDDSPVVSEIVTVNTEIIEDGLKEMGTLITQEYYFTQVEEYKSTERVWIFDSKASFIFSYDGVVTAGIDCNDIDISKDDEAKLIKVQIPKSEIIGVNIDHDSFKIYEEKEGLWNKLDMTKYNNSIIEFENEAKSKALNKGIIDKADENAKNLIESFINSLLEDNEYSIEFINK
ncbi:MAG: DUF4230 domain-containing protein [Lachnospiraceae bacterium]|nr:DUF4230 domain-containing protein [Lachnospiraceae bacterium]MBP5744957.1 DUF4230 domain-containing protein [Lachnospiraceae bacterium]